MPKGWLRRPSTSKTWRATIPSERKADGHVSTPPRLTKTGSADGGPRVYATRRSTTTLSSWGFKNRCGKDLRPHPSAPQASECRRWAAGLRHQEFVEFLGVFRAEVPQSSRPPRILSQATCGTETETEHSGAVSAVGLYKKDPAHPPPSQANAARMAGGLDDRASGCGPRSPPSCRTSPRAATAPLAVSAWQLRKQTRVVAGAEAEPRVKSAA